MVIRPFDGSEADYARFVALANVVEPHHPVSVAEQRRRDSADDPKYRARRFVVEGGATAFPGAAAYGQNHWDYHPQQFTLSVMVHPDHRRRGWGARLYDHLLAALTPFAPTRLQVYVREDKPEALRFLDARGYTLVQRNPVSRLDVAGFDFGRFTPQAARVADQGIVIRSVADLRRRHPDVERRVWQLETRLEADIPRAGAFTPRTFEEHRRIFDEPNTLEDGMLIALDGDRYIGMCELFRSEADPTLLYQGMTGVLPGYRRRGIATALKVAAVRFAHAYGALTIHTDNEENNPMLDLNRQLGFVADSADLTYEKRL